MKDHEIAQAVNRVLDIAIKYRETQQLRSRIAGELVPLLKPSSASACSTALYLPKITPQIENDFAADEFGLIEYNEDGEPEWTQEAVDFVALLNQTNRR